MSLEYDIIELPARYKRPEFAKQLLGRLISDCDYVLNAYLENLENDAEGIPKVGDFTKHLWAHDVDDQLDYMYALKVFLEESGEGCQLSDEDFVMYEEALHDLVD